MRHSPASEALDRARTFGTRLNELRELGATPAHLSQYRIRETRTDPVLFAIVYLGRHLTDKETGLVGLSDAHIEWADIARGWLDDPSRRDAIIAPRSMGKSTWFFLILPLWAAAHGHRTFVAAFANSAAQAEMHLATFKRELDGNRLLRYDFPALCTPRIRNGRPASDSRSDLIASSGFAFAARGADTGSLGMKVDDRRPDLIICDDLEPGEGSYSAYQVEQRLTTLLDDILPLNVYSNVALIGTTVMGGSIVDQLRESLA